MAQDPGLQVGLSLLGGVILAVLLEVTPLAGGFDAGGDLRATPALELVEL